MSETPYLPGLFEPTAPRKRDVSHQRRARWAVYPSSKQVAFAERIARLKRREIPRECFQNRQLMSRWIDGNKPR